MDQRQQVTVVEIKMPFGSMVVFMVGFYILIPPFGVCFFSSGNPVLP